MSSVNLDHFVIRVSIFITLRHILWGWDIRFIITRKGGSVKKFRAGAIKCVKVTYLGAIKCREQFGNILRLHPKVVGLVWRVDGDYIFLAFDCDLPYLSCREVFG
jgi:hypothetical protein